MRAASTAKCLRERERLGMPGVLNTKIGYVFIHVPKCAGVSISSLLLRSEHATRFSAVPNLAEVVRLENALSGEEVRRVDHARARDICNAIGRDRYNGLQSFAVVRNPWERLKSRYFYRRKLLGPDLPAYLSGTFSDFVLYACADRPLTMHERLTDRDGRIMVRHLLRYENLSQEFAALAPRVLGGDLGGLPWRNASLNQRTDVHFTRQAAEAVRRAYQKDFSLFGYSEDMPTA